MSIHKEILYILNNNQEPIHKRIKIADNAFNSSELPAQCKALLLKWILENNETQIDTWKGLNAWVNSSYFKELSRNEIDNKDIGKLIKLLEKKIVLLDSLDNNLINIVINTTTAFFDNRIFQQYVKFDVGLFCCILNSILMKVDCSNDLMNCMKSNLFHQKNIIAHDHFCANFLQIVLPTLVKLLDEHYNEDIFLQISRSIQKCIFYNNHRNFGNFINKFFVEADCEDHSTPTTLFNYISNITTENPYANITCKLIFQSFASSYENDFELTFKFLVVLLYIIGFDKDNKTISHQLGVLHSLKTSVSIENPQDIILEILNVLGETKYDLSCKVNDITLTSYLNDVMKYIFKNEPSNTNYKIISKIIKIDPLIVQSLAEQIIIYLFMVDIENHMKEYEELMIMMFSTYSKLHRIENFLSKLVGTLNNIIDGTIWEKEEYAFARKDRLQLITIDTFTEKILMTFSACIGSLASWQVINIFKTLLFSLRRVLQAIEDTQGSNSLYIINIYILSELIGTFLSSIRIAEHTVTATVVEKSKKCLQELQELLILFAKNVLNREHNHVMMRSFLKVAYNWAEITMVLKYYSPDEDRTIGTPDNNSAPCNLTFLHPYLTIKQWCLISERINNFGEPPCKQLLYKMYIQKLRGFHLFTHGLNEDMKTDLVKSISNDLEYCWKFILEDKFLITILLPAMEASTIICLVEKMMDDKETIAEFQKNQRFSNSPIIFNAIIFICIKKINKLISRRKRKHNEDGIADKLSAKIWDTLDENIILCESNEDYIEKAVKIYNSSKNRKELQGEIRTNEEKIMNVFEILTKFPVIFCSENIHKICLLYFSSLNEDLSTNFNRGEYNFLRGSLENIIIGFLQHCKFKLTDIFDMGIIASDILNTFVSWEDAISQLIENMYKQKDFVTSCETLTSKVINQLYQPSYMDCSIIIMNALSKLKKSKIPKEIKVAGENLKNTVCDKISELISKETPNFTLLTGYAYIFKHYLSQNDEAKINEMANKLESYLDLIWTSKNCFRQFGSLSLLTTILQNKSKLKNISDNFSLKIWNACKEDDSVFSRFEEYSQLILLIVGHIPNEKFEAFMKDLSNISDKLLAQKDFDTFGKHLLTWESVITINLNPTKTKILQHSLEELLYKIMNILKSAEYDEVLFENLLNLQKSIMKANHLHITPPMIDTLLINSTAIMDRPGLDFQITCSLSISMLSSLLKYRKPLVMDRLPPYLQHYRKILGRMCNQSNSDLKADEEAVKRLADCAHQLEKLTRSLVLFQKDMGRIAMYLIMDILVQYEQITLYPNVKIHLNNCIYSLISICDQHAVSYLMRVLSTASTEMFKMLYESYKKYYRFTGKV